jgi:hypothetical protein
MNHNEQSKFGRGETSGHAPSAAGNSGLADTTNKALTINYCEVVVLYYSIYLYLYDRLKSTLDEIHANYQRFRWLDCLQACQTGNHS